MYHLNPSGRFVIGGPQGDAGLTGRKIIVDTYGGWVRYAVALHAASMRGVWAVARALTVRLPCQGAHGGGAFSGKDFTKVDRSAAYAARWIAKSLVAAGLCHRVLVQLSYAIGVAQPLSIYVDSYGTSTKSNVELEQIIRKNFDLRPGVIVRELDLRRPIYQSTACYGHFGRPEFTWEQPKKLAL